ncbi:MAG: RdgB/HAM1 family non-canonical purine NTP pyrophosphatase [Anaerolineaceae bacterium]|nr:MAG: RdgB/HAM1 family non-canonical purine NTP pyrophosphatase [Anaerolineaceae bacterium]
MKKLLLASGNPGKQHELRALLDIPGLVLLDPSSLNLDLQLSETGEDYSSNAELKASAYAHASGMWALADDSGLEVDVLEGAPGPRSARLGASHLSDADRRQVLLEMLHPHPRPWKARFCAVVALASPEGVIDLTEGICEGEIISEERGTGGFGYDPIFLVHGMDRTMAELSMDEKNQLSHRSKAIEALMPVLRRRLGLKEG